ncbi:IS110 family transposase [Candidatus Microthrix parvicella]|uniref:IS110 family transposase n=1 Tax=Candidatus Neomicrothrix parvicella TaxID=41950 RepID=UPI0004B3D3C7|nr:IS110 family transposase [Candidatus Microthrix parvicella]
MTIMIGIDPHKATHTAVAIDGDERVLDEFTLRASKAQTTRLRSWAGQFDGPEWAVESARGLGYLLAQQLVAAGETVFDVPPLLASRVRVLGSGRSQKNDPNDARSVAIAAMRSDRLCRVTTDDHAQVLRLLVKRHRDTAQLRAKLIVRLSALTTELSAGGIGPKATPQKAIELLKRVEVTDEVARSRVLIAGELLDDVARLDLLLKPSKQRIETAVVTSGTTLCDIVGIGPICAATIIGYTGNIGRFPTRAHFATYNATAPIEASSGGKVRHRLNPRGNRQLNFAIHIAAVVQIRSGDEGRVFYDRKIAEGRSNKEATRSLKNDGSLIGSTATSSPTRNGQPRAERQVGPGGQPGTTLQSSVAGLNPEHRRFGQVTSRTRQSR